MLKKTTKIYIVKFRNKKISLIRINDEYYTTKKEMIELVDSTQSSMYMVCNNRNISSECILPKEIALFADLQCSNGRTIALVSLKEAIAIMIYKIVRNKQLDYINFLLGLHEKTTNHKLKEARTIVWSEENNKITAIDDIR